MWDFYILCTFFTMSNNKIAVAIETFKDSSLSFINNIKKQKKSELDINKMKENFKNHEKVVEMGNRLIEQEKTPKQRKQRRWGEEWVI